MTKTKSLKKTSGEIKPKQKRKNPEQHTQKEVGSLKPSKKARKNEEESNSSNGGSVVSVQDNNEGNEEGKEGYEENHHLTGFSSEEEDSSDEEVDQTVQSFDVSKLPHLAKEDVALKKRLNEAKSNKGQSEEPGVLYLGRIPHGFYEDEMRSYFSQFGDVTRLRLSRNKKTGHSKHYAFIEFSSAEVAQIVSETMHNYLLMGHILQCRVIPKDQIHPELWIGANRRWRYFPRDKKIRANHNRYRTLEEQNRSEEKLLARQRERQKRIKDRGIDYDIDVVAYKRPIDIPG